MLLIALGAVLKRTIADDSWTHVLNKLAIYLLFPALIFSGMVKVKLETIDDFSFIYGNFIILVLVIFTLYMVLKRLGFSKSIVNTYVIAVLEYSVHEKLELSILTNTLKNPLLLAVLFSIVILAFKIELPFVVTKTVDLLAGGATPIILISLGIFFARELPKNIDYRHVVGLISLKLIVMPMIFFLYFSLSGKTDVLAISVLEAGMPIAITPFILAELYPMEKELIALSIVISCILSVVTLPIIMVFVGVV